MNTTILDSFSEGDSTCYLIKVRLSEYIESLPLDFQEYEIQREIVNNIYLDKLIDTLLEKKHIPLIVLVASQFALPKSSDTELRLSKFKILDGLQRTYRLKAIYDTLKLFERNQKEVQNIETRYALSRRFRSELDVINSSTKILESISKYFSKNPDQKITDLFDRDQWFEIWTGLSPKEEVNKMLVLNAGHKPVKTRHQLELLFTQIIPLINEVDEDRFELIREKSLSSPIYSKKRKLGQFHFAHILTSLLSFSTGKPLTSNINLIEKAQSDHFDDDDLNKLLNFEFLEDFIATLIKLDKSIKSEYGDLGVKWLGRETSLVGIFAGLGKHKMVESLSEKGSLNILVEKIISHPSVLNLKEYEHQRNTVDLGKVNIGTVNKNAVYEGIIKILENEQTSIDWKQHFPSS